MTEGVKDRGKEKIQLPGQKYITVLAKEHKHKLDKKVNALNCYEANAIINELTGSDWPEKYTPGRGVHP